ncbi:cationic amino acid transporter 1-like [Tasmannia lanceolata]|uniref:cationic amino acid transporter 1-like n=1 Tax=Tasmannia lanceolata TaxID=3420 RepID=UPI0040647D53
MGERTEDGGAVKRKGCMGHVKNNLFPEESFKSWENYTKALGETPTRLKDRILTRSLDETELNQMRARSQHSMKKNLNWWDIIWFSVGAVIGARIFVLTGLEAREEAGPAVILSYAVSGISAMLAVFCYTEFAVEIPVAEGSFAFVRVELGDFIAFIAAGNIVFQYIVSNAAVARSWTSYFATLLNLNPDKLRIIVPSLAANYNHIDPIAVLITIIIGIAAALSTKGSSRFNYIATIVHLIIIVFIIITGLTQSNTANYSDFAPYGARGIFKASAVLFFAYIGFDAVSTMAEETENPARDIPIGLVGSMSIIMAVYCLLALTLCLMQPYKTIDENAPFSVAFEAVGMNWAKYIVAFGALKGMTTVLLAAAVGQARYLTHIARTHMVPPWLAKVNEKTGTPVNATIVMVCASAAFALFTELSILSNLLSIATLFIFSLVAIALLVRQYYIAGETSDSDRNKLVGFLALIVGSSVAVAVYWAVSESGWMYVMPVPLWFLGTLGLRVMVKEARKPRLWGVPFVPWLPSASIGVNVFLLGSIDGMSFVRFGIWTVIILAYYFLFGLHASYDAAKETDVEMQEQRGDDDGVAPVPEPPKGEITEEW